MLLFDLVQIEQYQYKQNGYTDVKKQQIYFQFCW